MINPYDVPKTTNKETVLFSSSGFVGNQTSDAVNSLAQYQAVQNQRDTQTLDNGFGPMGGGGVRMGNQIYDSVYKQTNNDKKLTGENYKSPGALPIFTGEINISKPKEMPNTQYMGAPGSVIPMNTSLETRGQNKVNIPHGSSDIEVQRINPDILKAFRENPYTFSLTNSV